ncbi:MAG: type 1 glutamine amidotransferase domain-containing protein [Gammaproteobacteria bacterium]
MAHTLQGKKVAILAADGVEQVELVEPRRAVTDAGASVDLVSVKSGKIQAYNHDVNPADSFAVDRVVSETSADDYDALILPGGTTNPDHLRQDESAVDFVRGFFKATKPVGVICHGPWTLIEADVVRGRKLTSWPSLRTDLRNAGAEVVDEGLVSSRGPQDLPAFCAKIVEEFAEGKHAEQARSA